MPLEVKGKSIYATWISDPMKKFMSNSSTSGIVLLISAVIAIILSNTGFKYRFHEFWEVKVAFTFGGLILDKTLHHWINDGLMAVFFFVVGLELKREILSGELSSPRKAMLPLAAAVGGMVFPAAFYLLFNHPSTLSGNGWGIPMATDIAFALGVLYMMGDKVPVSLKIFLTALAIADDLGAVLVIAFFYTSDINFTSLLTGAIFMAVLLFGNFIGIRNTAFYGLIGIFGLWLAFLMSGVHATIAAVLAAFTIPNNAVVTENIFNKRIVVLVNKFRKAQDDDIPGITGEQQTILARIKQLTREATTPLQRLEHSLHPLVSFIILPIFALANAGITITQESIANIGNSVTLGVATGLFFGKLIGITGFTWLIIKIGISELPQGTNWYHIIGVSLLGGIGFTMSLFITELAFESRFMVEQAKMGIIIASLLAGIAGYFMLNYASRLPAKNKFGDT